MPTTCCVINCHRRHSRESGIQFYRFPVDPDRRRRWLSFVARQNADGSSWKPGPGDRLCSCHFISGKKSNLPSNPDYVPSVHVGNEFNGGDCEVRMSRFERARRRSSVRAHKEQHYSRRKPVMNSSSRTSQHFTMTMDCSLKQL